MIKEKSQLWHKISMRMGHVVSTYSPFPAGFYTLMSLLTAIFAVIGASKLYFKSAIVFFIVAGVLDVVDGSVARARNKATPLGAFMDGTIDRFVDFAIIFSFYFFNIKTIYLDVSQWISLASFVVIMPSFIVAYANHRGAVDDDHETLIWRLMNRGEMLIVMMGILILSLYNAEWAGYLFLLLIVLSTFTIIQTMVETMVHSKRSSRSA